jgi:hypothetical protein
MLSTIGTIIGGELAGPGGAAAGKFLGSVVEAELQKNNAQSNPNQPNAQAQAEWHGASDPNQAITQYNGGNDMTFLRNLRPSAGMSGTYAGNLATQGNTALQQGTYTNAQQGYTDPNAMALQNQQMSNEDQERLFRMGQQGAAYQNQLQQDIERGRTYNTLATQGQNLAAQNAQQLANAYTQARNANAQLLQGAISSMGVR